METITTQRELNTSRGLLTIAGLEKIFDFGNQEGTCLMRYCTFHRVHPFSTQIDCRGCHSIRYLGAESPHMSAEIFVLRLRKMMGSEPGKRLTRLRIVNMPLSTGESASDRGYVFFEIWNQDCDVILSSEFENYSGAGIDAIERLEEVFAVLANECRLALEKQELSRSIDLAFFHRSA